MVQIPRALRRFFCGPDSCSYRSLEDIRWSSCSSRKTRSDAARPCSSRRRTNPAEIGRRRNARLRDAWGARLCWHCRDDIASHESNRTRLHPLRVCQISSRSHSYRPAGFSSNPCFHFFFSYIRAERDNKRRIRRQSTTGRLLSNFLNFIFD